MPDCSAAVFSGGNAEFAHIQASGIFEEPGGRIPARLLSLWSAFSHVCLALNELKRHLGQGVGLREHGHCRLRQDLVPDKFGHFGRHINVGDA